MKYAKLRQFARRWNNGQDQVTDCRRRQGTRRCFHGEVRGLFDYAHSLAKDLSGERKGGIEELRAIPGFIENEASIRKENALHLAMMEAKKRSGLSQSAIARRLGMPQPNVSRIEHSEVVSFNTFAAYLFACGFDFTIDLQPVVGGVSRTSEFVMA